MKYRVIIFLTSMLLLGSLSANSQYFFGGLQAGINGTQIWGDKMKGFNKGGLIAGVFIDFPVSKKAFLTMEMNYTEKGSRSKDGTMQTAGTWTLVKVSYLEVPLLINYKLSEKADLNIGLSYGIKVGHKYTDSLGIENPAFDPFRNYDFEMCGGGNYRLGDKFKLTLRAGASLITVGKGKSNPIWSKTNTGLINIVTTCTIKYFFLKP
jgi:hypothetical protein